jgi:hypothetical protein
VTTDLGASPYVLASRSDSPESKISINYKFLISQIYNYINFHVIGEILSHHRFFENAIFRIFRKWASGARGRASGTGVPPRCHRRGGPGAENAAFSTV